MRPGMLLLLVILTGCHTFDSKNEALLAPPVKLPPPAVTAEQVHTKNAHEKATALFDEIEFENARKNEESVPSLEAPKDKSTP